LPGKSEQFQTDCDIASLRILKLESGAVKKILHAEIIREHSSLKLRKAFPTGDINDSV